LSDLNLVRYYQRLSALNIGVEIKTALPDLADIMCTSPRHARNLLKQMQALEWLNWDPKVGRSQRSTLVLNHHLNELKERLASKRILAGKYAQALTILEQDQMKFGRLLQNTSGASVREGLLHIQLTYKRPFERLVPHHLQRASERYFIRQLYCCLVKSTHEGELEPQLAHHWQYDPIAFTWTFYLRPGLTFHNSTPIDGSSIAELFNKLITLDHYKNELKHVIAIDSPTANKVRFKLAKADQGFGGLLSEVKYAIQPPPQVNDSSNKQIVGSGAFQVTEHSESKLCLQAFDHFYACRALTDQVTIWPLDEQELKTNQCPLDTQDEKKQTVKSIMFPMQLVNILTTTSIKPASRKAACIFSLIKEHHSR
jgi:MarR-like DNA-binding transcriptional regulator SgrR of sgrS sRNA